MDKKGTEGFEKERSIFARVRKFFKKDRWPLSIGIICLFVIWLAWILPINRVEVSFEVVSRNISLKLSRDWELKSSLPVKSLFVNNLHKVSAPELDIGFLRNVDMDQEPVRLILEGDYIRLKKLALPKDATIDLTSYGHKLILYSKGAPLCGMIDVANVNLTLVTEHDEGIAPIFKKTEDIETIRFESVEAPGTPVKIDCKTTTTWKMRNFQASSIHFSHDSDTSGKFESTVKSGRIKLLETGLEHELREYDLLMLKDIKTRRLECSKTDEGIKLFFRGSVSAIEAGPGGFRKNLAPTWLEYLYHQKKSGFFWSAVVSLWGLLWSFKNTISGGKNE